MAPEIHIAGMPIRNGPRTLNVWGKRLELKKSCGGKIRIEIPSGHGPAQSNAKDAQLAVKRPCER